MSGDIFDDNDLYGDGEDSGDGRNLLVVFVGFLLIGAALGLLGWMQGKRRS